MEVGENASGLTLHSLPGNCHGAGEKSLVNCWTGPALHDFKDTGGCLGVCPVSLCILWTWRTLMTVSPKMSCGRCFGCMGYLAFNCRPFDPCTTRVRAWFTLMAISQTLFQCVINSPRSASITDSVRNLYGVGWSVFSLVGLRLHLCSINPPRHPQKAETSSRHWDSLQPSRMQ